MVPGQRVAVTSDDETLKVARACVIDQLPIVVAGYIEATPVVVLRPVPGKLVLGTVEAEARVRVERGDGVYQMDFVLHANEAYFAARYRSVFDRCACSHANTNTG